MVYRSARCPEVSVDLQLWAAQAPAYYRQGPAASDSQVTVSVSLLSQPFRWLVELHQGDHQRYLYEVVVGRDHFH